VISSAITGVGSAKRMSSVRWGIIGQILRAWVMTLPVSGALGAGCYFIVHLIVR
jgi:inorganic phosphate transporter, PiT family